MNMFEKMNNIDMILYEDVVNNYIKFASYADGIKLELTINQNYPKIVNEKLVIMRNAINKFANTLYDKNNSKYVLSYVLKAISANEEILFMLKNNEISYEEIIEKINNNINDMHYTYYNTLTTAILSYNDDINPILEFVDNN